MNYQQFCAEYAKESDSGRILFPTSVVKKFISIYTHLAYEDFTKEMLVRLRCEMVDYYNQGLSILIKDNLPAEKIELPKFIFAL